MANAPLTSLLLLNKLDEGAGFNDDVLHVIVNAKSDINTVIPLLSVILTPHVKHRAKALLRIQRSYVSKEVSTTKQQIENANTPHTHSNHNAAAHHDGVCCKSPQLWCQKALCKRRHSSWPPANNQKLADMLSKATPPKTHMLKDVLGQVLDVV